MTKDQPLVSIVTPMFNSEKFLHDTIATIQAQTLTGWEAIFVDDKSSDDSASLIEAAAKKDSRIQLVKNSTNSGAGASRNNGVQLARGRYVSFLDADDLWHPDKLEQQLAFMEDTGAAFSCTGYEFADENGNPTGKQVAPPARASYSDMLTNVTTWTSTTIFDMDQLTKQDIAMPDIKRGQDAATWWKVLKKVDYAHGLPDVLSYYRRTSASLSANKLKAVQRTWHLYRRVEKISPIRSFFYLIQHSYNAARRRV